MYIVLYIIFILKSIEILIFLHKKSRQLAIFAYTIFAVKVLNFCVRDGNRCVHFAIVTYKIYYTIIVLSKQDNVIKIKLKLVNLSIY